MGACCDSMPFGEPCADCGYYDPGELEGAVGSLSVLSAPVGAPSDPAVQALAWGARTGAAIGGISGYWEAVLAADVYRRSGARSPAVDHFVEHALSEGPESGFAFQTREPEADAGVPVITGDPQPPMDDHDLYVPGRGGNLSTAGGAHCCCCLEDVKITAGTGGFAPGTARGIHEFTVEVTTSFKPSATPKPCRFEWLEMPYVKGEKGQGYTSPYTAGGVRKSVTVYRNKWNHVYAKAPDHPMFTQPIKTRSGRGPTAIDPSTGRPYPTIPSVLSTTRKPPNCPGQRTGVLYDQPGTSRSAKFSLYGVVSVRSGCPPTATPLVKARGASCAPTTTCKNIDVPWWAYIDISASPPEFIFWTPCAPGHSHAGSKPTHAQYDPWRTPKGFGDFPK